MSNFYLDNYDDAFSAMGGLLEEHLYFGDGSLKVKVSQCRILCGCLHVSGSVACIISSSYVCGSISIKYEHFDFFSGKNKRDYHWCVTAE